MTATTAHTIKITIDKVMKPHVERNSFRQDTLKAWEDYRATALHLTAEEADAWLAELEQGNDIAAPECHQ